MVELVDERLDSVVDLTVVNEEAGLGIDLASDFNEDDVAVAVKVMAGMMRGEMIESMGGVEVELLGEGDDHGFLVAWEEHTPSRVLACAAARTRATPLKRGMKLDPRLRGDD